MARLILIASPHFFQPAIACFLPLHKPTREHQRRSASWHIFPIAAAAPDAENADRRTSLRCPEAQVLSSNAAHHPLPHNMPCCTTRPAGACGSFPVK
jgi:hypothetical protein